MSEKGGESKTEIGDRLLARVEFARARYRAICSEAKDHQEIADACLGNSDGVLAIQRHGSANQTTQEALTAYQQAIQDLTDFVLRGEIPTDLE